MEMAGARLLWTGPGGETSRWVVRGSANSKNSSLQMSLGESCHAHRPDDLMTDATYCAHHFDPAEGWLDGHLDPDAVPC